MEGTSGHHEPATFTSSWSRWPWPLPHVGKLEGERSAKATPTFRGEEAATGVSEARSHRAPWEENAHARIHDSKRAGSRQRVSGERSAEAVSGVVKHLVPRSCRVEP